MAYERVVGAILDLIRRVAAEPGRQEPSTRAQRVDAVHGDGTITADGERMPKGVATIAPGDRVPVLRQDGRPVTALPHQWRRSQPDGRRRGGPIIEELFLAPVTAGDLSTLDVWFRNDQVCGRLRVREALGGGANAIPPGSVVKWGARDDRFLVRVPWTWHVFGVTRARRRLLGGTLPAAARLHTLTPLNGTIHLTTVTGSLTGMTSAVWAGGLLTTTYAGTAQSVIRLDATGPWSVTVHDETITEDGDLLLALEVVVGTSGEGTASGAQLSARNAMGCGTTPFTQNISISVPTARHAVVLNATAGRVLWQSVRTAASATQQINGGGGPAAAFGDDFDINKPVLYRVDPTDAGCFGWRDTPDHLLGASELIGVVALTELTTGETGETYLDPGAVGFATPLGSRTTDVGPTVIGRNAAVGFHPGGGPENVHIRINTTATTRTITPSKTEVRAPRLVRPASTAAALRVAVVGERYNAPQDRTERGLWIISGTGQVVATLQGWSHEYAAIAILDTTHHHVLWRRQRAADSVVEVLIGVVQGGASSVIARSQDGTAPTIAETDARVQWWDLLPPDFLYRQPTEGIESPVPAVSQTFLLGWAGPTAAAGIATNVAPGEDSALTGLGRLRVLPPEVPAGGIVARHYQAVNDPDALVPTGRYLPT